MQVSGSLLAPQPRANGQQAWVAKLRIDGTQKKQTLGLVWEGAGRPSEGYLTAKQARAALEDLKAAARTGGVSIQSKTGCTLAEVFDAYVDDLAEKGREATYLRGLRMGVRASIVGFFGDSALERITAAKCQNYADHLKAEGLADSTRRRYLIGLDACLKYAVKKCGLVANPMAGIDKPGIKQSNSFNVFEPGEILKLSAEATTHMWGALYVTAGFCGLRLGELRALKWQDVRWEEKAIMVRWNCPTTTNLLTTPKSRKQRSVPMAEPVREELAAWRMRSKFNADDDLVFAGEDGSYFSEYHMREAYNNAQQRCGFTQLRFHDLRHSAATIFARCYPDMFKVQNIMGHGSITVTAKYYHYRSHSDDADSLSAFINKAG